MNRGNHSKQAPKEVNKPYITGNPADENTLKRSFIYLGTLIMVFFISFIACSSTSSAGLFLRILINTAVIAIVLYLFFNNGTNHGAEAVARGEILYQKQEKGQPFTEAEKSVCFHRLKGFITALAGTLPFLVLAIVLAVFSTVQQTDSGSIPSWMQTYTRRSDIGNALVNYTQPEALGLVEYVRIAVRIAILPFVNLIGYSSKYGMYILEKISPLLLLLPAVSYGFGYLTGRSIRTRIHTVISENNRKRNRREKKRRMARSRMNGRGNGPEQLN